MAINPNSLYPGKTEAPDSDYPYGSARNVTTPGDGTGTPWEAALVNDIFGFQQELLDSAGVVPSGTPERVNQSQYVQAMRRLLMAAGTTTKSVAGGVDATLTDIEASEAVLVFTGELTASINVVVPDRARRWLVRNQTTGAAFNLTVKTDAGTGVTVPRSVTYGLRSDGVNVVKWLGTAAPKDAGTAIGTLVELEDVAGAAALPAVDGSQLTNLPGSGLNVGPEYNAIPTNDLARELGSFIRHNFTGGSSDLMGDIQFMDYWGNFVVPTDAGSTWRSGTVSDGAFSIVKVGGGYQAYFTGDGTTGIGMLTAPTLYGPWTDHGVVLAVGGTDGSASIGLPHVFIRPGSDRFNMVMFYSYSTSPGVTNRIGLALSDDGGLTWSKNAANPIIQPGPAGSWDEGGVQSASVFWDNELQKWVMAYSGWEAGSTVTRGSIGIATVGDVFDLRFWDKHPGNPVLTPTPTNGPEDFGLLSPTIWKEEGAYYLGYTAKRDDIAGGEPFELSSICIASGPDFDNFTRNPANPIINSRDYPAYTELECPQFVKIDDTWHVFCNAFVENGQIAMFMGVVNRAAP